MNNKFLASVAGLIICGPVVAAENAAVGNWYLSPGIAYIVSDDDRIADDGVGLQLGIGRPVNESWNIELNGVHNFMDLSGRSGSYDQGGVELNGLYFLDRQREWQPYGLLGAGAVRTESRGRTSNNITASIGAGAMKQIADNGVALRFDVRYRLDLDDDTRPSESSFSDWFVTAGFSIPFDLLSRKGSREPAADMERAADTTPAVDTAPAAVVADATEDTVDTDADNDGIMDSDDRCPDTPAGITVDASGCETDTDNDGVADSKDLCPGSSSNDKVDTKGCLDLTELFGSQDVTFSATGDAFIFRGVTFDHDSAAVTKDSEAALIGIAAILRVRPELRIEIGGHTDNRGRAEYNIKLSQQRAETVRDFLIREGVAAENVTARGYGSTKPVAENDTEGGRARNRRVELRFLD